MSDVVLYGRDGCHLCDDALAVIEAVRAERPFTLEIVDIDNDDALTLRYLERIPVVSVHGTERFEFFVDAQAFREALDNLSRPGSGSESQP